jgi:uncharacterized membrane protein YgaE (UPF0421/DUF939 family)
MIAITPRTTKDWLLLSSMAVTGVTAVVSTRKSQKHPLLKAGLVILSGALGYLASPPRSPHSLTRKTDRVT